MTTVTQAIMGLGLSVFFPKVYLGAALILAVLPDFDGILEFVPALRQFLGYPHSLPFVPLWLCLAGILYAVDVTLGQIAIMTFSLHLFLDFINRDSVPFTIRSRPVIVPFGRPRVLCYIQEILVGLLFLWIYLK